ncbi:hypothetical protein I3760_16G080600 [Carya illinoinensis]|nr:hypothetical protein I3760_16G080600 [Carya illinoinensis]
MGASILYFNNIFFFLACKETCNIQENTLLAFFQAIITYSMLFMNIVVRNSFVLFQSTSPIMNVPTI